MRDVGRLVHLLRSTPVRELMRALERDDFILRRTARTGGHVYTHPDGRMTLIHYHRGSDTLDRKNPGQRPQSNSLDRRRPSAIAPSLTLHSFN